MGIKKFLLGLATAGLLSFSPAALSTVYFLQNAESGTVGAQAPNPPWCSWQCYGGSASEVEVVPIYGSAGGAPQGSKYLYWNILQDQHSYYNETGSKPIHNFSNGSVIYMAFWLRIDRQAGGSRFNVYDTTGDGYSAEKGFGMHGPNQSDGIRWDLSFGCWGTTVHCDADRFTAWGGNPSFHFHGNGNGGSVQPCSVSGLTCIEVDDTFRPNQSGYTGSSPYQLTYETWHSFVMELTMSNTNTGTFKIWINGTPYMSYTGLRTVGGSEFQLSYLEIGGTLCQPAYDCPPHKRSVDNLMVSDSWSDVVAGGYLGAELLAPPSNVHRDP